MPRRIQKENKKISLLNIFENLNELFDSEIETNFREIDYGDYITYQFETKSNTKYDLEFHYSYELSDTTLNNGLTLGETIIDEKFKIECFDIAFTLSNILNKDIPDEFELETNKYEYIDLMGRISYIIKKLMNKYKKTNLFIIGNSRRNRMEIYKKIFINNFKNDFELYYGKSLYHSGSSLFIIRK
jgi:hypothetical protein